LQRKKKKKQMNYTNKTQEAVQLLKQLVAIPSLSREEAAAADLIQQYLQAKGYEPIRTGNNVWSKCKKFNESLPTILLDAHIDTVKPVTGWIHDPFIPEETTDGTIYGLGTNDDGASLVSMMQAFFLIDEMDGISNYNLIFSASCEEEISGKNGIESIIPILPPISFAVVGEPTNMQPAIAEKGLMVIDVTTKGVSGHAARNEGVNAIYKAIEDIRWIETHQFAKTSKLLGPVKATVTIIQAGTQHNVIPDRCQFTIDVRSNECYTNQEIFDEIANNLQGTAVARSFRLNSSSIALTHTFVQKAINLGLTPFGSPTLSNQALMPFPSIKIGPGDSSRSHTADEFIRIEEIAQAIKLYYSLLS